MNEKQKNNLSKFISLILRHKPETIGISLDEHGWANVEELINGIKESGKEIDMNILEDIVRTDNKQRYSFNGDKRFIRANQGHSVKVDVELKEMQPPDFLYHGTANRFMDSIMNEGFKPMSRLYVHLSKDFDTAMAVGKRHGSPIVLKIDAKRMYEAGKKFYLSENGVLLTESVDKKYIRVDYRGDNNGN
jgi:putative RNA 2'-phosphotransferase